jgi:hypothetical protein
MSGYGCHPRRVNHGPGRWPRTARLAGRSVSSLRESPPIAGSRPRLTTAGGDVVKNIHCAARRNISSPR